MSAKQESVIDPTLRALREVEARLRAVLSTEVDAIIVIDESGIVESINPAATRVFGYTRDEIVGHNVSLLMPEPYRSQHDTYIQNYLRSSEPKIIGTGRNIEGRRKDGSSFPMHLSVSEMMLDTRRMFTGIVRDLTREHAIAESLRESEERFDQAQLELRDERRRLQTLLDNLPGMAYRCINDRRWPMLQCSAGCDAIVGYKAAELVAGETYYGNLIHPDDRERVWQTVQRAVADKQSFVVRYRVETKQGEERWVWERGYGISEAVAEDRGQIIEGFITDITPLRQSEQEASELRENLAHVSRLETMGEMAAGIAHEINQPLSAIGIYAAAASNMVQADSTSGEVLDVLTKIKAAAHRAAEVIRRLRALVNKQRGERSAADINAVAAEVIDLVDNEARLANVRIERALAPALPAVLIDTVQVQQVLLNLIRNAIEASLCLEPGERKITVTTRSSGDNAVLVSVVDRGAGIPPEDADRIFDPFYSTKATGMGMGLAISRSIVEAHRGRCWYERNPDRGSTFFFTIGRSADPEVGE